MFNALEKIANSEAPVTPVLGCRISKALEPRYVLDDVGGCCSLYENQLVFLRNKSNFKFFHVLYISIRVLYEDLKK